jgi:hypothetical protein
MHNDTHIKMAMGNSLSGFDQPSPSLQGEGGIFPVLVPAKSIGGHLILIPVPRRAKEEDHTDTLEKTGPSTRQSRTLGRHSADDEGRVSI